MPNPFRQCRSCGVTFRPQEPFCAATSLCTLCAVAYLDVTGALDTKAKPIGRREPPAPVRRRRKKPTAKKPITKKERPTAWDRVLDDVLQA